MTAKISTIGIYAKPNNEDIHQVALMVIDFLAQKKYNLFVVKHEHDPFDGLPVKAVEFSALGTQSDLVIVIGGDGSLLKAARTINESTTPVVGINRGRIGFLADISPDAMIDELTAILDGQFKVEHRTLLNINVERQGETIATYSALNDAVLYNSSIARMLEFDILIDGQFVSHQRSDGLIVATPTGSTAYALSAGGPILYPTLEAISLVPMFPHTLSARPLVIKDKSVIRLRLPDKVNMDPKISFDGQIHVALKPKDEIEIKKHPQAIQLLHPKHYHYYSLLREKLGWNTNISSDRYSGKLQK